MHFISFEDITEDSKKAALIQFPTKQRILLTTGKAIIPLKNPSELVVLGHTEGSAIVGEKNRVGGFSAKEMAVKFGKMVSDEEKMAVKDIYLIACEAGWNDSALNHCFARQLACELYQQGFIHVKVHAITSPVLNGRFNSMRVELVTNPGVGAKVNVKTGDGAAFLCTKKYDEIAKQITLKKNEKASVKVISPLENALENEKTVFMESDDLKAELDRPENTFVAAARVEDVLNERKDLQDEIKRANVAKRHRLIKCKAFSANMNDKKFIAVLDFLINLQNAPDLEDKKLVDTNILIKSISEKQGDWEQAIFERMDAYHNPSVLDFTNKNTSSFYALLRNLVSDFSLQRKDVLGGEMHEMVVDLLQAQQISFKQIIINKSNSSKKIDITLISGKELIEFSLEKNNLESSLAKLINSKKLIPQTNPAVSSKIDGPQTIQVPAAALAASDKPKPKHKLLDVNQYYVYATKARNTHFWNQVKPNMAVATELDLDDDNKVSGDLLKGKILEHFKKKLNKCNDVGSFKACVSSIKESEGFKVLNTSQGFMTSFLRLFASVQTDSVKALNRMVEEKSNSFGL